MRSKKETIEIHVPSKYANLGFGQSYMWGYEAGLEGKPMPRTGLFGSVEQYEAWRDGHAAGVAASSACLSSYDREALVDETVHEADASVLDAEIEKKDQSHRCQDSKVDKDSRASSRPGTSSEGN